MTTLVARTVMGCLVLNFHFYTVYTSKRVILIPAITIFQLWKNAIIIHVIGNLPLQFFTSLNRAILYVFDAFGPTRRPAYFRMAQNTAAASLPSTH